MENQNSLLLNALTKYLRDSNGNSYKPSMVNCVPSRQDELRCIALFLCGTSQFKLAFDFMEGGASCIEPFIENVSFNDKRSAPVIVRAIELHLINRKDETQWE